MATPPKKQLAPKGPTTKEQLKKIFDLLKIKTVYYVDDENNLTDFDVQIVVGEIEKVYSTGQQSGLKTVSAIAIDPNELPKEGIIESIRRQWSDIEIDVKKEAYKQILSVSKTEDDNLLDFSRASMVNEQIPDGMVRVLSPQQWDDEKVKLPSTLDDENRALILFDEELRYAGGRFDITKGQDLIVEVKKMELGEKTICTLLTNKTTTKEELPYRDRIIKHRKKNEQEPLEINDFFPLSKQRLDSSEVFADGIKKTLINKHIETIKLHTVDLIGQSYKKAMEKISLFDTYDFEEAILKSSHSDGVWEPETIVRISDIAFENELKRLMKENNFALKVNPHLKASLNLVEYQFDVPHDTFPYPQKYQLRHYEIYDTGEVINFLRKPLENGDIFQMGEAKYILVAQPCDMAVRTKNKKLGLRTAKTATLLKIQEMPRLKYEEKMEKGHYLRDLFPLEYFTVDKKDVGIVDFKDYLILDIDLLDFCVYSSIGECKVNLVNFQEQKQFVSKPWEARLEILVEKLRGLQDRLLEVRAFLQKSENRFPKRMLRILPRWARNAMKKIFLRESESLSVGDIEIQFMPKIILASTHGIANNVTFSQDGTFDFGIKRISKFKDFGAAYLLDRYTRHLSRVAEPHDFAYDKKVR